MVNVKSIRRQSFIEAYGIKEDDAADAASSVSSSDSDDDANVNNNNRKNRKNRKSLTIDDLDMNDINITIKHKNSSSAIEEDSNNNMDISALDFDNSGGGNMKQSLRYDTAEDDIDIAAVKPPNFAGGASRRRGSKSRRMRQRSGEATGGRSSNFDSGTRRASTGQMDESLQGSFMSLASFSSNLSGGSNGNGSKEVGNLLFVTDAEMEKIMYGDEGYNSQTSAISSSTNTSSSSSESNQSNLAASLAPSSILGTGAFSTVRLAWRRNPKQPQDDDGGDNDNNNLAQPVSFDHFNQEQGSRRSVVRVQSQCSGGNGSDKPGELVAVKIIQKSILKQMKTMQRGSTGMTYHTAFDNIEREIATMKLLKHPNLVKLYEVIDSIESDRLHMVLEYVSLGEIMSHVEGSNRYRRMRYRKKVKGLTPDGYFDEKHAALYLVDIMHGLAYLHRNRICHRDLKPEVRLHFFVVLMHVKASSIHIHMLKSCSYLLLACQNILLCSSGVCKISDFGVAHIFEDEKVRESYMLAALDDDDDDYIDQLLTSDGNIDQSNMSDESQQYITQREGDHALHMSSRYNRGMLKKTEGTYCFWSPEMCAESNGGFSGYTADLWAAGVCLYIFTTGTLPFFSLRPGELFDLIESAKVKYEGLGLSNELIDLLGKLLDNDPKNRAGVGDCLKHQFCAEAREERLSALGNLMSDQHIILSKNDIDTALSVTLPFGYTPKHKARGEDLKSKRVSAPAASLMMTTISSKTEQTSRSTFSKPKPAKKDPTGKKDPTDSTVTNLTETSTEVEATAAHHNSDNRKMSFKGVGVTSKFKLKNLWRKRKS